MFITRTMTAHALRDPLLRSHMSAKALLVTGASRGIGRACALLAGRNGWAVGVNYREDTKAADAVVEAIAKGGGRSVALKGDIAVEPMCSGCSTRRPRR